MILITSYLHREVLSNLIRRWMYNKTDPQDAHIIVQLVHFNHAFVSIYLSEFAERIFKLFQNAPILARRAATKAELKDTIVTHCPYHTARIDEMVRAYCEDPGKFYRETPFQGSLYHADDPQGVRYIGATRIKRVRRLAEKCARRIIDRIYADIKNRAESLAKERARRLGLPMEHLITPRQEMEAEFLKAENRLLDDLKNGRPIFTQAELNVQDVAGLKVVVEDPERHRFLEAVGEMKECEILEIEEHQGNYKAVNLLIRHKPDRDTLLKNHADQILSNLEPIFGNDRNVIRRQFDHFVRSGEEQVNVELIISNYQEMLESEIGCCMHEDRILRQRLNQQYTGQLARNIEFLMAYLFAFASSRQPRLITLPIRLWDCYLPDYFDEVLKNIPYLGNPRE